MRKSVQIAVLALITASALATVVSAASARNLSTSNQNFRITWRSLEFASSGLVLVKCQITIEGSFHSRTIQKVERSLIGYITRGIVNHPCTGSEYWFYNGTERLDGNPTLANSLPWHITYERFTGTLPNITTLSLLLSNVRFRVFDNIFNELCIYTTGGARGNWTMAATRNAVTGVIDNAVASGRITPDAGSGGGCPALEFRSGATDGIVTLLGSTAKITVTLI